MITLGPRNSLESIKEGLTMEEFTQGEYVTRENTIEGRILGIDSIYKLG